MFGKVIVFGLFEIIQKKKKKKEVRTASSGPGSASGSGRVQHRLLSHLLHSWT